MKLNIAVVDDLAEDRRMLERELPLLFSQESAEHACVSVRSFADGESFLRYEGNGSWQMVFLDIFMDGIDGFETARRLRERDVKALIVFLTSSRDRSFEAFPLHPFEYLVKPCTIGELRRVAAEACRVLMPEESSIEFRISHGSLRLRFGDIAAVIANGHSVEIVTADGSQLRGIDPFFKTTEPLIEDPRFLMCNRGVLINMDHALRLRDDSVIMKGGRSWPLRRRDRTKLITRFTQYQIDRIRASQ